MMGSQLLVKSIIFVLIGTILVIYITEVSLKKTQLVNVKDNDRLSESVIPTDAELYNMTSEDRMKVYGRYTNTIQILCRNIQRFGSLTDRGKEVCMDTEVKPRKKCLVYSFGSNNAFDFEKHIVHSLGCDVRVFDPSMGNKTVLNPSGTLFYHFGLNGVSMEQNKMYTLGRILEMLKHEKATIDILKMDIESYEWNSLKEMMESGSIDHIRQLLVEFHYGTGENVEQLIILRRLQQYGFKTFSRERNVYCGGGCNYKFDNGILAIARLVEMSFINVHYIK